MGLLLLSSTVPPLHQPRAAAIRDYAAWKRATAQHATGVEQHWQVQQQRVWQQQAAGSVSGPLRAHTHCHWPKLQAPSCCCQTAYVLLVLLLLRAGAMQSGCCDAHASSCCCCYSSSLCAVWSLLHGALVSSDAILHDHHDDWCSDACNTSCHSEQQNATGTCKKCMSCQAATHFRLHLAAHFGGKGPYTSRRHSWLPQRLTATIETATNVSIKCLNRF